MEPFYRFQFEHGRENEVDRQGVEVGIENRGKQEQEAATAAQAVFRNNRGRRHTGDTMHRPGQSISGNH